MISVLEMYYQTKIAPENTLIIFDEIQMCERALTSLKYFWEEVPVYAIRISSRNFGMVNGRKAAQRRRRSIC